MKTSNKILLAAVLIIIAYLVGFDFALKTEYDKGAYKSRFYKMQVLKFNKFNSINHNAANIAGLRIEQGTKYGVWIKDNLKDKIAITQQGDNLTINYIEKKDLYGGNENDIIIICPQLTQVTARPFFLENEYPDGEVIVAGFKQTVPINIRADRSTGVRLQKNLLSELNANFGINESDMAHLSINNDNHIALANINLKGRTQLNLFNPSIAKGNYHFGDSTTVTLFGQSLKMVH